MAERIGTKISHDGGLLIAAGGITRLGIVNTSSRYGVVAWVLIIEGPERGLTVVPARAEEDAQDNLTQQVAPVVIKIQERYHDSTP